MGCKFDNNIIYKKWDIVSINFGVSTNLTNDDDNFNKNNLIEKCGINIRYEFSLLHLGVIITPSFLNKDNKVLVIPITSFNPEKHDPDNINHFILYKRYYRTLKNDSVMLLDEIRSIDIARITKKHNFHLKDTHKKVIKEKLQKIFIE